MKLALLLLLASATFALAQGIKVDPKIPAYTPVSGVSGNLNAIGSDTLNNLMVLWSESFNKMYPNVNVQIEGKGSSTAPPALAQGTSQLGPMSRKMKDSEMEAFEAKKGYKPTPVGVALDSLAVFVHKDNPIEELSMDQIDGIFSSTRNSGSPDITSWGQVGLTGPFATKPFSLYGRNSASGTYGYFKSKALGKGDYKSTVKEQPGSASVVNGIGGDLGAIGYSGIGYKTSAVRTVALAKGDAKAAEPTYEKVLNGAYPLGRMLYIYIDKAPGKSASPAATEFLKFILSKEGQEIVVKDGYLPLTAPIAAKQAAGL